MIECIFTVDYEVYGNGEGSLKHLVYEPTERLIEIFRSYGLRFVAFVEVAELEIIESHGADQAVSLIHQQIRYLYDNGFEIGLHLHPQWYNAYRMNGRWIMDYNEYNLCILPRERITKIVDRSLSYLRRVLNNPDFTPICFRAGNWLFQPTKVVAEVLSERGIKIDSSVFKGGLQRQYKLDYRRASLNGYYWTFSDDVDRYDRDGVMLELPIYTEMVPTWKLFTAKRIGLQGKAQFTSSTWKEKLYRFGDFLTLRRPLKFDFCRMTLDQLTQMIDKVVGEDRKDPHSFRPIVAIGHTKDTVDLRTIDSLLAYLTANRISLSNFEETYAKCLTI